MALTQKQVSELYVSIFGRASEGGGNKYWQTKEATSAATADAMLATPDAEAYFGTSLDSPDAFIKHIYKNTLNKEYADDSAGIDYWVSQLAAGKSRGEVVAEIVYAVSTYKDSTDPVTKAAYDQFNNRVEVSNYVANNIENVPANGDLSVFKAYNDNTTNDVVTKDAQIEKVDNDVAADGGTGMLTASIAAFADAKTAKTDWLKSLDALDMDLDGKVDIKAGDIKAGKATEANVNDLFDTAAGKIAAITETTLDKANYKDLKKTALQDADIQTAVTITQSKLDFATSAAKKGMTALIEAANASLKAYNDADKEQAAAKTSFSAETQAFLTANKAAIEAVGATQLATNITTVTDILFLTDSTFDATVDYSNKLLVIGDNIYKGLTAGPLATAKAAASQTFADLNRDTNLTAANTALVSATTTETNALTALEEAVGKVYVSETGGHSLADIGTAVTAATGTGNGSISFIATDVVVYKTAAEAAKGVGKTSTIISFTDGVDLTSQTVKFDGVTVTVTHASNVTGAAIASALIAENGKFDNYTVKAVAGQSAQVEFIYNDIDKGKDVAAAKIDVSTKTGTTATAVSQVSNSQVETGDTTKLDKASSDADALKTAIKNMTDLEKAIADFQAARELKVALEEKEDAITAAKKAITNATDDKDAPGLGMNLRDLDKDATTSDDIFVFDANATSPISIANFGKNGNDYFFFGSDYSLFALPEDKTINDNVGNVSVLEIIWEQVGNDLNLYVEKETFAGSATGTQDMVTITLTGVNAENVSFTDGMLTIA